MRKTFIFFFVFLCAAMSFGYKYELAMPLSDGVYMALAHVASNTNASIEPPQSIRRWRAAL